MRNQHLPPIGSTVCLTIDDGDTIDTIDNVTIVDLFEYDQGVVLHTNHVVYAFEILEWRIS